MIKLESDENTFDLIVINIEENKVLSLFYCELIRGVHSYSDVHIIFGIDYEVIDKDKVKNIHKNTWEQEREREI